MLVRYASAVAVKYDLVTFMEKPVVVACKQFSGLPGGSLLSLLFLHKRFIYKGVDHVQAAYRCMLFQHGSKISFYIIRQIIEKSAAEYDIILPLDLVIQCVGFEKIHMHPILLRQQQCLVDTRLNAVTR